MQGIKSMNNMQDSQGYTNISFMNLFIYTHIVFH